jgi:hypothetical protein
MGCRLSSGSFGSERPECSFAKPAASARPDRTYPVRRLFLFVASVQASMDVNELGDLSRARVRRKCRKLRFGRYADPLARHGASLPQARKY